MSSNLTPLLLAIIIVVWYNKRMKKAKKNLERTAKVTLSFTPTEKELLVKQSEKDGRSLANFCQRVLLAYCGVIEEV